MSKYRLRDLRHIKVVMDYMEQNKKAIGKDLKALGIEKKNLLVFLPTLIEDGYISRRMKNRGIYEYQYIKQFVQPNQEDKPSNEMEAFFRGFVRYSLNQSKSFAIEPISGL